MLLVGCNFAIPLMRRGYKEGFFYLLGSGVLVIACALAVIILKLSVIVVILGAAVLGALFFSPRTGIPLRMKEEQGEEE